MCSTSPAAPLKFKHLYKQKLNQFTFRSSYQSCLSPITLSIYAFVLQCSTALILFLCLFAQFPWKMKRMRTNVTKREAKENSKRYSSILNQSGNIRLCGMSSQQHISQKIFFPAAISCSHISHHLSFHYHLIRKRLHYRIPFSYNGI